MSDSPRYQLAGYPAAAWAASTFVLLAREVGLETDTRRFKVGDGVTPWNSLPYAVADSPPAATLVTDTAVPAGLPLAINRATGRFVAADALIYPRAVVVGLAAAATQAGYAVDAAIGAFTLPDWTAVAGAAALSPGQLYFLREGGGLTIAAPTARGSAVAVVGEAVSVTTLRLRLSSPILL
ncbi:hypothetical protein [Sphingomonas sp. CROZ-RG-20F-R02-07]|uniref:hyaluronate lyase N-terminal domain-containing protein n=1 Tax=Sphingomonas sp. CROZ-RG-20F-R02-07 TaxID=2914832 RepID=UPI001F56673B|nr:hypothetical protein [Sphingomonas sp. CROZ-RG-20F-R02-07]